MAPSVVSVGEVASRDLSLHPRFMVPWRPSIARWAALAEEASADSKLVTACMLLAFVTRETNGENIYQIGVPRGPGCGVGLCQITSGVDWTDPNRPSLGGYANLMDPLTNLKCAVHEFIEPCIRTFPSSHVAAFAAYNLGGGGVAAELAQHISADSWTTGHDYGLDVFQHWINYAAASLGLAVDWSTWQSS